MLHLQLSNIAGTTLLKSFSVVIIFLKILRELGNNFPEENVQKAGSTALIRSPLHFRFLRTFSRETFFF